MTRREREREIHHWVMDTCLLFGTDLSTALRVALVFVEGLREEGVFHEDHGRDGESVSGVATP